MDIFTGGDTRACSPSSELTRDGPSEFHEQEETSSMEYPIREDSNTEWTDEKHSLYLKSIEASFVDQLYNSMDVLGWRPEKENLSNNMASKQLYFNDYSHYRQRIQFERPRCQLNKEDGSAGLLLSPWIRRFRPVSKPQVSASLSLQESSTSKKRAITSNGKKRMPFCSGSAASFNHFRMCHSNSCDQDSIACSKEMSDQNFSDEEIKDEQANNNCSSKKIKTATDDASSLSRL